MYRWYHPSWCGDFRLEALEGEEDRCKLIVHEPTLGELEQVGKFLVKARKKGWIADTAGIDETGGELLINASVNDAGHTLLAKRGKRRGIITVIKSVDGELEVVKGDDPEELAAAAKKADAAAGGDGSGGGSEAVTTRRPTLCCPKCVPGPDRRASEVLAAFCTPPSGSRGWPRAGSTASGA